MNIFKENIDLDTFKVSDLDISDIRDVERSLPNTGVFDLNIAELGLISTLRGENLCQEKIVFIDRYIGFLDGEKSKAWTDAALSKSKAAGYKTAKDKEWIAAADTDYIIAANKLTMAKATKRWLEKKAGSFEKWHYAFKSFLRRDYSLENISGIKYNGYNNNVGGGSQELHDANICGDDDIQW